MTIERMQWGARSLAVIKAHRMAEQRRDKEVDALDALADATASGDVARIRQAAGVLTECQNFYDYAILDLARTIRDLPGVVADAEDAPAMTDERAHEILTDERKTA